MTIDKNGHRGFANQVKIAMVPPSANKYQRMHWAVKRQLRNDFTDALQVAWTEAGDPLVLARLNPPKMRVQITVCSLYARKRRLDVDNLYGGCKPLIDAMRDVGLIRNDSPVWLDLGIVESRNDGPFTIIEHEPFNAPAAGPAGRE